MKGRRGKKGRGKREEMSTRALRNSQGSTGARNGDTLRGEKD